MKNNHFQSDNYYGLLLSLVVTFIYLFIVYPKNFFLGTSSYWLTQTEDITQYIAGFNAYFSEDWHFPLFKIESFNYPIGTRSTFVDIIPLFSFILKLVVPNNFFPFNPFGFWILFSYLMSSVAAWFILKNLKINSWIALITLILLFDMSPALSARIGHISLMSHWLILFAFALYIRNFTKKYQVLEWSVLLFISFYINIYIFTIVFSVFLVTIITTWKERSLWQNIKILLIPLSFLLVSLFLTIFPLSGDGISKDFGWGYYSMNFLSPLSGGNIIKLIYSEVPGQYEGFNYLGLGVILLCFYNLYLLKKLNINIFTKHKYMLVLLILFFIYSLSYKIYFGNLLVLELNYPSILEPLTTQFRASGRFFWPVGYAIIIFNIIMIMKVNNRTISIIILIMALFIQIIDLKERTRILKETASREENKILNYEKFKNYIGDTKRIYFYPKFRCAKVSSPQDTLLPIMLFSSENKIKLNTGYIARYEPNCNDIATEIESSDINNSTYLFMKKEFNNNEILSLYFSSTSNIECKDFDFSFICQIKK